MQRFLMRLPATRKLSRLGLRLLFGASALVLALGACLIDERKYDQHLADCTYYCDQMEARCVDPNKVYDRPGACMAVCMLMDQGDNLGGADANTVACRVEKLRQTDFEPSTDCAQLGPGSNGACGSNCEALCTLRQQVCGPVQDLPDLVSYEVCMHNCQALPDLGSFDASRDRSGDSVQCRLIHVSESAISHALAVEHCEHTQTIPVGGEKVPCSDPAPPALSKEADCQKYCGLVMGACVSDVAVYDSAQQCMSVCRLLDQGEPGDQSADTVRCRRYHSYSALGSPNEHCTHAGPTGDGHCGGGNCPDYCRIARQSCPSEFAKAYGADSDTVSPSKCETDCADLVGAGPDGFRDAAAQRYNVTTPPQGNTLLCRTYHAVRALAAQNDERQCAAAFGLAGSECQ
jgi:hypothetical protein